jgi:hypothetical protein
MTKTGPDHHDADLILKIYDLRREPVMRVSRTRIFKEFNPKTYADFLAVTMDFENPLNVALRQTSSYWEMVYGFARRGVIDPEFLVENNGEGIFLYAKVKPFIARWRQEMSPTAFQNAEWVVSKTDTGQRYLAMFEQRLAAMAAKG